MPCRAIFCYVRLAFFEIMNTFEFSFVHKMTLYLNDTNKEYFSSQLYTVETRAFASGVKRPRREATHLPLSSAHVKNYWSYTSTPNTPAKRVLS
jgi:hypothetical protein